MCAFLPFAAKFMWPSENARQSFFPVGFGYIESLRASHECGVGVCFAFREHSHYDNSFALGVMHSASDLIVVVVLGKLSIHTLSHRT